MFSIPQAPDCGWRQVWHLVLLVAFFCFGKSCQAEDVLTWNTNQNLVTADIKSGHLFDVLEGIATLTRWQVFVEPDTARTVSAKFKDLSPGEALPLLLGNVNYALVPATNKAPRLYVFRTSRQNATQMVKPAKAPDLPAAKPIPNELIVRLKPGAKIDELAKLLGAKVVGKIDSLNAYRLKFDDQAAADSAREQLGSNPTVDSVDSNYAIDAPPSPQRADGSNLPPPPSLQLKPPGEGGRLVVGLIDTGVQPLGNNLDQFLLKAISIAGDGSPLSDGPTHGTAMAETLLRSLQGITKGSTSVQILPVTVFPPGADSSGNIFDIANGIVQAVNHGAKVINLSLGSYTDSSFLRSVVSDVAKLNIPLFAAAGNEPVATPFYPAAYPEVSAVTAVDQGKLASYASRGTYVSLGAPGNSIVYFNDRPYYVVGTSASSAYASGLAIGYMDSTKSDAAQAQAFLKNNFGVKISPGQ